MFPHHFRHRDDQRILPGVLPPLDFRSLAVAFLAPEPDLPPAGNPHEVVFVRRPRRAAVRVKNIGMPPAAHVVDHIQRQRAQHPLKPGGPLQRRRSLLHRVPHHRDAGIRLDEIARDDVNLVIEAGQPPGKLPGPMLQPSSARVKMFQHEPDFHGRETVWGACGDILPRTSASPSISSRISTVRSVAPDGRFSPRWPRISR